MARGVRGKVDIRESDNPVVIDKRRDAVARLVATKASLRTIARMLVQLNIVNPDTHEPWSHETIRKDVRALRNEWRKRAAQATDEWMQEELASLDELEQMAWSQADVPAALGCKRARAALLGLNAPVKVEYAMPPELVTLLKEKNLKPSDVWATMMRKLTNADR